MTEKRRILVVDDDALFRGSVVEVLRRHGHDITEAANGPAALEILQDASFDLIISDMKMPGMSGIELLEKIRALDTDVPVLIVTAFGDIESAVDAMKKGAKDYIQKSDHLISELEITTQRLLEYRSLLLENRRLKSALGSQWQYLGETPAMQEVRHLAKTVAESRATVLISGESGTGKELVARSIHYLSQRSHGPFVKINCAALPEGLIESELFGHEKGAFTGAIKRKLGKFELASNGTLLLDEIGEMPVGVQAKLLRVLQEREISKVGGDNPIEVDVRVVATTNRDLEKAISDGAFREDLYYRLNVFHIHLPPLRERIRDIPQLVEHFIQKFNNENGFGVEGISPAGIERLTAHDWPGNIRELENVIERAVVLARDGIIPPELVSPTTATKGRSGQEVAFAPGLTIGDAERELIFKTLQHCGGNRTKAAGMLGISVRTLRNKLTEYGVAKGGASDD